MEEENGRKLLINKFATLMKVTIQKTKKMATAYSHGKVETYIEEIIKMIKDMGMGKYPGQMAQFIKDNG